jgi:maltose phosphorylase
LQTIAPNKSRGGLAMKELVGIDEWKIVEDGIHMHNNRFYESLMSLGNGYMGMRGNFEEGFSGDTLQGTYIAGVYYPDKTRVGWWKNGYPEYFAKVINAPNFIGIDVILNGEKLDVAKMKVMGFKRELDMQHGCLKRYFTVQDKKGNVTEVCAERFLSLKRKEAATIKYSVTPVNYDGKIELTPYIDGNISNEDSNYDEKFWNEINRKSTDFNAYLTMETKKLGFRVTCAMKCDIKGESINIEKSQNISREKYVGKRFLVDAPKGKTAVLYKYITVTNNRYINNEKLEAEAVNLLNDIYRKGYDELFLEQKNAWNEEWEKSDIVIEGDAKAQQAIRFNIFQLSQTYRGDDPRLNIGPKGFTGEKYGGCTYWDTEAYCLPFYLSTHSSEVSKNLLIYRYKHLEKAKENARKLGFKGALYPMVTMNGEECHNEWEITFEEIHRNAAISYAIFNYVRYTGDEEYLPLFGYEVLVETSRFWADRVTYNKYKDVYMILGVTGPNEYENNVNNNWYTNKMAAWNLKYTLEVSKLLEEKYPKRYEELKRKLKISDDEFNKWKDIINKMYYPYIKEFDVFEQQDGYMDKEQILVSELDKKELPINQHWSWDRILRSCFIKQADVLQGLFFLGDEFDIETKKRNFDFYEPRTVHESSLSSCVHSILASEIGYKDKAYKLYLRTARLDLDNYNNDTDDGLHITSMAGTWMTITYGFGGMRIKDDMLSFNPYIPDGWEKYSFKIFFRNHIIKVAVEKDLIKISQSSGEKLNLRIFDNIYAVGPNSEIAIKY